MSNTQQNLRIFCDLDGLLASLFDAVSHKLFNKTYKQITPDEKQEAKKIWYDRSHFVNNFGDVEEFFATLPPYGRNGELTNAIVDTVVGFAGSYKICSHPAGIDPEACKRGKITWIKAHLHPQPKEMLFPQSKAIYATTDGKPDVLIDDFPPYIKAWRDAGGIAIEMRTDSYNSPEQVKAFLTKELHKAKKQIDGTENMKESFNTLVENLLESYN
jgi:hypothetical protein